MILKFQHRTIKILLVISVFLYIAIIPVLKAAYDRHDGSNYSCNEIYVDRHLANTDTEKFKYAKEYIKYCFAAGDVSQLYNLNTKQIKFKGNK